MFLFVMSVSVALSVSFLCSLMEACLLSLSLADIARMSADRPRAAAIWKRFKENIQRPIAVILIINTLAHTIGASVAGSAADDLFGTRWIFAFSLAFSLAMIQWTEILPKALGVRMNRQLANWTAVPLEFLVRAFTPLVWVTRVLNRPFEGRGNEADLNALNEIAVLTRFAAMQKLISQEQAGIMSRSMNLSRTLVSDVMVERSDIRFLSTNMKMHEAFLEAHVHRHTRFLLVEENNLDRIVGYVNFKDIVGALKVNPRNPTLLGIMRPILTVKAGDSLIALLNQLTKNHQHIAIVRRDDGTTAGMVTLEDVMEAIVGDIQDEFDVLPGYLNKLSGASYLAGGGARMSALRAAIGPEFPDSEQTLNEWLHAQSPGQPPKVDSVIHYQKWALAIRRIRRSAIFEVTIDKA